MTRSRIVVVEDDDAIGSSLMDALDAQGYDVRLATSGTTALSIAAQTDPELVLLDLGLPDLDGVEVCRRLRAAHPLATIVVLTARSDEIDVVVGLDAGADDYLTKPFRLAELLARLRAHLRRAMSPVGRLAVGDLVVDTAARRSWIGEREVVLRTKEFDLLALLARDAGRAVTRERIMSEVWDEHWFGSTKTLDMHISSLRRKIDGPNGASRITTLRGVGYRLDAR